MDTIDIGALVNDAARRYGVDPKLANTVVTMESQGNPNAQSKTGAIGVMQLMPATAHWLGVKDPWDPVDNINGGMKYLAQLNSRYDGDPRLVLAAYNAGPGAVDKHGGVPPFKETQNYVKTGMGMLGSRLLDRPQAPAPAGEPMAKNPWAVVKSEPYSAPAPSAAPASESAKDPWAVVKSEPFKAPEGTSSVLEQQGPLARAGQAFYEGVKTPVEIAKGIWGEITGDQPAIERGRQALGNYVMGIGQEPRRIAQELEQTGQAIREGDLPGIAYHTAGAVPFFGAGTQQVADDLARGDYAAAAGHAGALAVPLAAGPALGRLGSAATTASEAAGDAITRGAWAARNAIENTVRGTGQVLPDLPAAAAGGAIRGVLYGNPILGAKAAVAAKLAEAARTAVREALEKQAAQAAPGTAAGPAPAAPAAPAPAAPAALPPSRQLPPPAIVTRPPADTSGVTAVPAQYPEVEPGFTPPAATPGTTTTPWSGTAPAAPAAPPAVVPAVPTLDELSQSLAKKPYAKLNEADQAQIQAVRERMLNPPVEAPPAPVAPAAPPPVDPRTLTIMERRELIPGLKPRTGAPPAPAAPETPPAPQAPQQIAQALKAEMERSGTISPAAPAAPASLEEALAGAEPAPPPPPMNWSEVARARKVDALFDALTRNRIPPSMIERFRPQEWDLLARHAGVNPPSETSIAQLKQRLADYEQAQSVPVKPGMSAQETQQAFEQARAARSRATIPPDANQAQAGGGPAVSGTTGEVSPAAPAVGRPAPGEGNIPAGSATTLRVPGESATYPARYTVRELDDVQPSHNPHNFEPNPEYTLKNDRNYSDPANQERIVLDSQPGRFIPEYLITDSPDAVNGPPVIDPSGNVLGGNSRAMKLARVYANSPEDAAAYRALLERRAASYGLDPQQIRNMRQPILVRELTGSSESPQRLITDLNKSGTASLTAAERATADARRLSGTAADYLAKSIEAEGPDATLNDALSGKRGAQIINQLVDDGVFTTQEKPALVDAKTGAVTAAAKERISKMLLGQVFADSDQMLRTPAQIRNKLERIVAPLLQSGQTAGFDLVPQVRQSLDLLEYARAHGISNLSDALGQSGLFGDTPKFSAATAHLAQFLRDANPTAVAQAFRRYAANIAPTMFGESTPAEAFSDAFGGPSIPATTPTEAQTAFARAQRIRRKKTLPER